MRKSISEIADFIGGQVEGDKDIWITGLSSLREAQEGDISFLSSPKYAALIHDTKASAIVVDMEMACPHPTIIRTKDPSYAFSQIAFFFAEERVHPFKGIHETALIGRDVKLGENVSIGPYTVIDDHVSIGAHTTIYGGCYLAHHTRIGEHSLLFPHVTVYEKVTIGNRVIIHSGVVIGADGFGYVQKEGKNVKIPQIGTVIVEDDVEIGANVCIDRARIARTIIGQGTKIDNLVQIGHNAQIGQNCIIVAQVGVSGSVVLEDSVIIGGQVGLSGHQRIGKGSLVLGKSLVTKDWPPYSKVWGYPAKAYSEAVKLNALVSRLPQYVETIKKLQERVNELEKKLEQQS